MELKKALSGKWKLDILYRLAPGPLRWSELVHSCCGAAPNVLTRQLRQLEQDGLVLRRELSEQPPQVVEYTLTDQGKALVPVVDALAQWTYAYRTIQAG